MADLRRERRRDFRYKLQAPLQIRTNDDELIWGETLDLSTRGMCCSVDRHIPPLSTLNLTVGLQFSCKESVLMQCEGTVVRSTDCDPYAQDRHAIAMYFLDLDLERAQLIKDFLMESRGIETTQENPRRKDVIHGIPGGCRISYIPTDQQLLSKGLTQIDRLANVGELACRVAHEIRNPLAGMAGTLEILARDFDESHPNHEMFQEIFTQICRIDEMVDHLKQYSSPDPPADPWRRKADSASHSEHSDLHPGGHGRRQHALHPHLVEGQIAPLSAKRMHLRLDHRSVGIPQDRHCRIRVRP